MSPTEKNTTDIHYQAEKNISLLFQNMTSGYALHEIICNADSEPVDYRFLAVNPAFENLTGLKAENLVGKTCLEALPGTEKYWIEAYGKVALAGEVLTFENYSSELNKYFLVTAYAPEYGKFVTLFSDITEKIEIEHKLVKAEENYRTIFNSVTEALFIQDSETGKLLDVNETMLSMYGYDSKEEVMSKSIEELSAVDEGYGRKKVKELIYRIQNEGQQTFEWRAKRKDGSTFWVELYFNIVLVGNDKILLVTGRDIEKRKHAELELQRN